MFVADLHNDVLQRAIIGEDISIRTNNGHSDLIRLQESCIDLEVFVVWVANNHSKERAYLKANELYDKLEYLEKECGDPATGGSGTVFVNGIPVHRQGDGTGGHGSWVPNNSASGSPNVIAGG